MGKVEVKSQSMLLFGICPNGWDKKFRSGVGIGTESDRSVMERWCG